MIKETEAILKVPDILSSLSIFKSHLERSAIIYRVEYITVNAYILTCIVTSPNVWKSL